LGKFRVVTVGAGEIAAGSEKNTAHFPGVIDQGRFLNAAEYHVVKPLPVCILFLSEALKVPAGSRLASSLVCTECLEQVFRLLPQGMRMNQFIPRGLVAFYAIRITRYKIIAFGFIDGF
jgi:hypothetical protein